MGEYMDIVIVAMALIGSIVLVVVLLSRARAHAKPEPEAGAPEIPATASRRQRRIVSTLEPATEIPTLMDMVRQEIVDLGISDIPGAEEISDPVALKVFKRDSFVRDRCTHNDLRFVVTTGVEPAEALDDEVLLFCPQCGEANEEESGTNEPE